MSQGTSESLARRLSMFPPISLMPEDFTEPGPVVMDKPDKLIAVARERDALKSENSVLKIKVCGYLILWAMRYQRLGNFDGLHPSHFDRLKELGARMDDFKRANIDGG